MAESPFTEKISSVACLGPEGSYSMIAAEDLCPGAKRIPCKSFYEAAEKLKCGEADCAVLPVENALQGAVTQNLDLLYAETGMYAVRQYLLQIGHCLIAKEGARIADIRRVFSHEQALLQCGKFFAKNLPQAEIVYTNSTAESVSRLENAGDAGIVGSHVRADGYAFLAENIADEKKNFTQFLLVRKGEKYLPEHSERVYFAATCPHEPGSLLKMLQILAAFDLNMTRIESRPIKSSPGNYRFFIEFEGDRASEVVRVVLSRLETYAQDFKLLGCY